MKRIWAAAALLAAACILLLLGSLALRLPGGGDALPAGRSLTQ